MTVRSWLRNYWMTIVGITIVILMTVVAFLLDFKEARDWERFKAEHKCKVVGRAVRGTTWLCDDGVQYVK